MAVRTEKVSRWRSRRGSFVVGTVVFLFMFFFVAALAVDMARYFYTQNQTQNIADGATLAAANAYDQVRTLNNLDESDVVEAGLRYLRQQKGYDEDVYELSASLKTGDVMSDRFEADSDPVLGDTVIRIGLNVKHAFEPYFMPRQVFGDEYYTVQAQAVAELRPVFWQSNLYDPHEPGPPKKPLRYSIFSEEDIKAEDQNCFVIGGDLHSNQGYVKTETMNTDGVGDDCRNGSGDNDWSLPDGTYNYYVDGDLEVGDPSGNDAANCGGGTPDAGCVVYEDVDGELTGDIVAQDDIEMTNGPAVGGDRFPNSSDVEDVDLDVPPDPSTDPDQYPQPVCEFEDADTTVSFSSAGDFDDGTNDCSKGGTIYVKGGDNLELNSLNPSAKGNFTFVADGFIRIQDVSGGDFDDDTLMFYSRNEWVKVENLSGDVELQVTFYAPTQGDLTLSDLCDPVQEGCVKIEANSGDLTINGSIVAGTLAKVEQQNRFRMNWQGNTDVLPEGLRKFVQKNNVPDDWRVHLIQ